MSGRIIDKSRVKTVLLLSLLCFSTAILAIAYHHHDTSFLLRSCAICNVKSSLSGSSGLSKINKIDAVPAPAVPAFSSFLTLPVFICSIDDGISIPKLNQFTVFHSNRAPPVC